MDSSSKDDRSLESDCSLFEDLWRAGSPPDLLAFLRDRGWSPGSGDQTLARELVCIDLELRWRHASTHESRLRDTGPGPRPAAGEYAKLLYGDESPAPPGEWIEIEYRMRRKNFDDTGAQELKQAARDRSPLKQALERIDRELQRERSDAATIAQPVGGPTTAQDLPIAGQEFGGYLLLRKLGEGGMGAVFEAEEIDSGRLVALKLLKHSIDSPDARSRFFREGRLAASINHPNSVYVFGTEEIGGTPAISMERIAGCTLDDRVKNEGAFPIAEAVDAILQVVEGLEAAADKGVLHRDVKPSNCFIDADGIVKVGDFGLSISTSARGDSHLTTTGSFLGTPAFSSPEQLRGEELDVRSDIYAVGVTLFQLLTGRTPYQADNMVKLLATVLEQAPPSPREFRDETPRGLARVVLKCLAKQPSARFPDYAELRKALTPYGSAAPAPAMLGVRSLAGAIDCVLMFLIGLFAQATNLLMRTVAEAVNPNETVSAAALTGCLIFYASSILYYAVPEGLWGCSLGKWLFGLRVVNRNNAPSGMGLAAVRALLFVYLPQVVTLPVFIYFSVRAGLDGKPQISGDDFQLLATSGFTVHLIFGLLFSTARRTNGYAAVHDLITGLRVVGRVVPTRRAVSSVEDAGISEGNAEHMLGPYDVLEKVAEEEGECMWLAYDKRLLRRVWVRQLPRDTPPLPERQRDLARPGRLRWINGWSDDHHSYRAYECPSGRPLVGLDSEPRPWSEVRYWLVDLAREMRQARDDGSMPDDLSLSRVWITSDGRAKLLDFAAPGAGGEDESAETPQRFLAIVARHALQGDSEKADDSGDLPSQPLPVEVRGFLAEIAEIELDTVAERLDLLSSRVADVSRQRRLALVASVAAFPVLSIIVAALGHVAVSQLESSAIALAELDQHLSAMEDDADPDASERRLWENYIAGRYGELIRDPATWEAPIVPGPSEREYLEQIASRPPPSAEELEAAAAHVEPLMRKRMNRTGLEGMAGAWFLLFSVWLVFAFLPSLLAAVLLRRGLLTRIASIDYVRRDGTPARRRDLFAKAIALHSPVAVLPILLGMILVEQGVKPEIAAPVMIPKVAAIVVPVIVCLTIWSSVLKRRGITDYLCAIYPVPH